MSEVILEAKDLKKHYPIRAGVPDQGAAIDLTNVNLYNGYDYNQLLRNIAATGVDPYDPRFGKNIFIGKYRRVETQSDRDSIRRSGIRSSQCLRILPSFPASGNSLARFAISFTQGD